MSEKERDIDSTIYSALRHPIRRRILSLLSERTRTFTEMLNVLKVESSHLTYHLESLGELISKAEDGSYKLSASGQTAVSMMGKVARTREKQEGGWRMNLGYLVGGVVIVTVGFIIIGFAHLYIYNLLTRLRISVLGGVLIIASLALAIYGAVSKLKKEWYWGGVAIVMAGFIIAGYFWIYAIYPMALIYI